MLGLTVIVYMIACLFTNSFFYFITDPRFGISCLGKVSGVYESDMDLMVQFYGFVAK